MQQESHITLSTEQFNLLMDKLCDIESEKNELKKMVTELTVTINSIREDTYFVKKIYTAPKKVNSKTKISKEEKTNSLLNRITSRGKKS